MLSLARPTLRLAGRQQAARAMSAQPSPFADLAGKVVVVGGAGNPASEAPGMGATTAMMFAKYGCKVVSVAHVKENCDNVTAEIKAAGGEGVAFTADCTDYAQVEALREFVMNEYGRVDCLVNAGIHVAVPQGFAKMSLDKWKQNMDLNLNAHFHLIHAFLPIMQEQKSGNIIHYTTFGSSGALGMGKQRHGYFAGKAAAAVLTKRIGIENAKNGIRANVVSIGYAEGPLITRAVANAGADMDAVDKQRDANVPRGKQITPEEIANVALFVASDWSSSLNATEVYADGGNTGTTYGP